MPTKPAVTSRNLTLRTGDDYRAAAAARQAAWRKRHFALHGELAKIVDSLAAAPELLDKLGNSELAKAIRDGVRNISEKM